MGSLGAETLSITCGTGVVVGVAGFSSTGTSASSNNHQLDFDSLRVVEIPDTDLGLQERLELRHLMTH